MKNNMTSAESLLEHATVNTYFTYKTLVVDRHVINSRLSEANESSEIIKSNILRKMSGAQYLSVVWIQFIITTNKLDK